MEKVKLEVLQREEKGTQAAKKLKKENFIPGVVYKKGETTLNVKFGKESFYDLTHTQAGENVIVTLKFKGDKKIEDKTAIIKEVQYDPVSDDVLHVDFNQISLTEKITVNVPVVSKGEPQGVKEDGILVHTLRELEVKCLPTNIPQHIETDISPMNIGDLLHVKDIVMPPDVEVLTDPEAVVFSVEAPKAEVVEEVVPGEEAAQEPEVLKQKAEAPEGAEGAPEGGAEAPSGKKPEEEPKKE